MRLLYPGEPFHRDFSDEASVTTLPLPDFPWVGRLEEEIDGLSQVREGAFDGPVLTRDVEFRAKRHIRVVFSLDDGGVHTVKRVDGVYLSRHIDGLGLRHSASAAVRHKDPARFPGAEGTAHRGTARAHPRTPGDVRQRGCDRRDASLPGAGSRIPLR